MLLLLVARRIDPGASSGLGWVDLSTVPNLPEWSGARTSTSLAAQVRREIKCLHQICPSLVETPSGSRLKGPFRLTYVPRIDGRTRRDIESCGLIPVAAETESTSETLYSWLEDTEPIWRSFHYFDKPGEALTSLPTIGEAAATEPLTAALAHIAAAKRLRDVGDYDKAQRTLRAALAAARREPQWLVRQYLEATCSLGHAWVDYRTGDLDAADRWLASVDSIASNGALLRLRGQMLNLRSLVRRSRRQYALALDDLRQAARLFLVEGDLFHLFAVYHNLACLVAAEAADSRDEVRRSAMYRRALGYSERNEKYCRRYDIGRNSVLNKLLQVSLHRKLGQHDHALRIATDAERMSLESQNFPDALRAHRHRLAMLLARQPLSDVERIHEATLTTIGSRRLREMFRASYVQELELCAVPVSEGVGRKSIPGDRGRKRSRSVI